MTIPAFAKPFGERLPTADEREAANQARAIVARCIASDGAMRLYARDGGDSVLPVLLTPAVSLVLLELLRHIGNGDTVTLVPISQRLTTQQAADILNVSRPYLISLLEAGKIEHEKVGRHRRIRAEDLFRYKAERDSTRDKALSDLAALDADYL